MQSILNKQVYLAKDFCRQSGEGIVWLLLVPYSKMKMKKLSKRNHNIHPRLSIFKIKLYLRPASPDGK